MFGFSNKPGRGISNVYFTQDNIVHMVSYIMSGKMFIVPFVPFIPFMLMGPFTAGFTYVIRNYAKQEPTFLISDFFEQSKKNIKQALITSVLSVLFAYVLMQAFVFYNYFFISRGMRVGVFYALAAIVFILYTIMMFYIYPLMVTFKLKLGAIIKNAWIFTISKLPQNLIIFILLAAINVGVFYLFNFVLYLPSIFYFILFAFFLVGFNAFTANYYIWHIMDKYIVQLVSPKKKSEAIFDDDEYPDFPDDYDEGVLPEDEYLL